MMAVEWEEFQEWAKRQSLSVDPVNSVCVCVQENSISTTRVQTVYIGGRRAVCP